MNFTNLMEGSVKKWPGFVQLTSLLAMIGVLYLHQPKDELTKWQTVLVLAVAVLLYKMGSRLDDIVFDPLYGLKPSSRPKRVWRPVACWIFSPIKWIVNRLPGTKEMPEKRKAATERLRGRITGTKFTCETTEACSGIYSSAKTLFEGSEEWDNGVKPWLEMSKVTRSLVWPLIALLFLDIEHDRGHIPWFGSLREIPILKWFAWWEISFAGLFLALVLYVWLRAFHMRAMYKLVNESEYSRFPIGYASGMEYRTVIPVKHLSIGETGGEERAKPKPEFLLIASR